MKGVLGDKGFVSILSLRVDGRKILAAPWGTPASLNLLIFLSFLLRLSVTRVCADLRRHLLSWIRMRTRVSYGLRCSLVIFFFFENW